MGTLRSAAHPSQCACARGGIFREHRNPRRRALGWLACAQAHAGLCGRWRCREAPRARTNGTLGRGAAMGGVFQPRGWREQWLRPSHAARFRPLGGHDRCAPPHVGQRPSTASGGGHGGHRRHGGSLGSARKILRRLYLARPRHHVARLGVGHGWIACSHRGSQTLPNQYQRCADQWRHLCHCRCLRAHGAALKTTHRPRTAVRDDRWCGLENGPQHGHSI